MKDLQAELTGWPQRLDAALSRCSHVLRSYLIVEETPSTQDVARQDNVATGTVIAVGLQTAGRGRHGKSWSGAPQHGLALSLVLPWNSVQHIAIASAIGVVRGLHELCSDSVQLGVKWPNDVLARDRSSHARNAPASGLSAFGWQKVSGILLEQHGNRAIVGIGINVAHTDWPGELAGKAVSLAQLSCRVQRIDVLETILPTLDEALTMTDDELRDSFARYDVLTGMSARLRCCQDEVRGRVVNIDPVRGLQVQQVGAAMPLWCPAESTSVLEVLHATSVSS